MGQANVFATNPFTINNSKCFMKWAHNLPEPDRLKAVTASFWHLIF